MGHRRLFGTLVRRLPGAEPRRVYGLILNAGAPLAFWPVLLLQSALTVWIIALILRAHGLGRRPLLLLGVIAVLSVLTTLPWLTSILLTDIFCGLGVLALYLLLLRNDTLSKRERIGLIALIAVAASTHNATMAVLGGLVIAAGLFRLVDRTRIPLPNIGRGLLAVILGAILVLAADYAVTKRLAWTPGGFALSFGHMLQDGIVTKYLDAHCPDPACSCAPTRTNCRTMPIPGSGAPLCLTSSAVSPASGRK